MADVLGVIAALAVLYFAYKFLDGRYRASLEKDAGGSLNVASFTVSCDATN